MQKKKLEVELPSQMVGPSTRCHNNAEVLSKRPFQQHCVESGRLNATLPALRVVNNVLLP